MKEKYGINQILESLVVLLKKNKDKMNFVNLNLLGNVFTIL